MLPLYGAMLEETDQHVGIIMDYLRKVDELANTYITSDNGDECIPRTKETAVITVPCRKENIMLRRRYSGAFVVAGPRVQVGAYCDVPLFSGIFLATLHDLSGNETPLPDDIDGGSLKDVFLKEQGERNRGAPGIIHHFPVIIRYRSVRSE